MKDSFLYGLQCLLSEICHPEDRVLVACSGGSDSRALFEMLFLLRHRLKLHLHVVHVDHGWREESIDESKLLSAECCKKKIPFYLKRITLANDKSNLEDRARKERWRCFGEVYRAINAQALLLGHHQDDLAETVLKRVFEGAHLTNIGGMHQVTYYDDMKVLRPLLNQKKTDIVSWLSRYEIEYFYDRTNDDKRFLRARMRKTLFPFLEDKFGKSITGNLCRLSERSFLLRRYFDRIIQPWLQPIVDEVVLCVYQLPIEKSLDELEVEHFFFTAAKKHSIALSSAECKRLVSSVMGCENSLCIERSSYSWRVEKRKVTLLFEPAGRIVRCS